jgi:hypothetical protein
MSTDGLPLASQPGVERTLEIGGVSPAAATAFATSPGRTHFMDEIDPLADPKSDGDPGDEDDTSL